MSTTWTTVPSPTGSLGPNLVLNGTFVDDSDWVHDVDWTLGGGQAAHALGGTSFLLQDIFATFNAGEKYVLQGTVVNRTAGSFNIELDVALDVFTISSNGTFSVMFTVDGSGGDSNLIFEPTSDFDGALENVSVVLSSSIWTSISSPIQPTWTTIASPSGSWTTVPAPSGSTTTQYGAAYGLLLAITQPVNVTTDTWTRVTAPSTSWTSVPKAT